MRLLFFGFILFAFQFVQAQKQKEPQTQFFICVSAGTEYKKNNSDSLTTGFVNYTPLLRLSAGEVYNNKFYGSFAISLNQIDLKINDSRIVYRKRGGSVNLGLNKDYSRIRVRNEVSFQFNRYSLANLQESQTSALDSFNYRANYFSSPNDLYLLYCLEMHSKPKKQLSFMGGINAGYVISKHTALTRRVRERIIGRIYFGLCVSI
ncbi:MAG: hypothetical protein H6605_02425 [Flavobacteriales bacterium]|nr:hypothetical protein [Flavobacteriales bacterium]